MLIWKSIRKTWTRNLRIYCKLNSAMQNATTKDFYSILNVSPKASQKQIKAAYYKLSLILHPDKNKNSISSHNQFTVVSEAYAILGNIDSRKIYDRTRKVKEHKSPFSHNEVYKQRTYESKRYDKWTRSHYQSSLARRHEQLKRDRLLKEESAEEKQNRSSRQLTVVSLLTIATVLHFGLRLTKNKKRKPSIVSS